VCHRSIVVQHLETLFQDDDKLAVACIYFNYKEHMEQTMDNLVASLLKQIFRVSGANSEKIKSLHNRHRKSSTRPTFDELSRLLELEMETYSKVFIVVDALDECREDDETCAKFLRFLRSLPENVSLMVTSRYIPSIAQGLNGMERLDIRATDKDVATYADNRINLAPQHITDLRELIVSKIVKNADGM
jgi:hypothetical protein